MRPLRLRHAALMITNKYHKNEALAQVICVVWAGDRSNVSDAEINRGQIIWEENLERKLGIDRCKPNFNAMWERHGTVVCERNRVFCRLSLMYTNVTERQTDRQTTER